MLLVLWKDVTLAKSSRGWWRHERDVACRLACCTMPPFLRSSAMRKSLFFRKCRQEWAWLNYNIHIIRKEGEMKKKCSASKFLSSSSLIRNLCFLLSMKRRRRLIFSKSFSSEEIKFKDMKIPHKFGCDSWENLILYIVCARSKVTAACGSNIHFLCSWLTNVAVQSLNLHPFFTPFRCCCAIIPKMKILIIPFLFCFGWFPSNKNIIEKKVSTAVAEQYKYVAWKWH